ncbi:MAG: DUF493 domain-containing protein [Bacteroidetes bacterium]|nr:DUF493 domain-containing protein [Bacteroidota bacterium]MBM3455754.1 DUF493 domain-containing protein [Bacteroidota bacterium]
MSTFDKLQEQLLLQEWPNLYLFKFIVPNEIEKIAKVSSLFNENCDLSMHSSSKGNYLSITVKEVMMSAEDIIDIYKKAAEIKGVITL